MIYFFLKKIFSVITLCTCYNFVGDRDMRNDSVVIKIMSDPKLVALFQYLKTSNWRKLDEKKRVNFYNKFNRYLCEIVNIDRFELDINDAFIGRSSYKDEDSYQNVIGDCDGGLLINDVNYNQYLTIREYLIYLRLSLLYSYYNGEYDLNFDDEKKEKIFKNFRNVRYGGVYLSADKEEGETYSFYQFIYKEAREFADAILFNIARYNYDVSDGYDEEEFMSNNTVLDNEFLDKAGEEFIGGYLDNILKEIRKVEVIKEKAYNLKTADLSLVEDKDLFFMVYPEIIKNSDRDLVVKCFNEIIRRIYSDDIEIVCDAKNLIINGNVYPCSKIDNLLNIILYECLNGLDRQLKDNKNLGSNKDVLEDDIIVYKKKWLLSVVYRIDKANMGLEFGVFNYQSVYRLLNKDKLNDIICMTSGNHFPFAKRRHIL